jgi:hypothetical protein
MAKFGGTLVEDNTNGGRFGGIAVEVDEKQESESFSTRQKGIAVKGLEKSAGQIGKHQLGEISTPELAGDLLGNAASYYLDTVGNAIVTGIKGIAKNTPNLLKDAVVESTKTFVNAIPSEIRTSLSEKGANILEFGGDAVDFYKELEKDNPRAMQQVENVANTLMAAYPAGKGNPVAQPTIIGRAGSDLVKRSKQLSAADRRRSIIKLIRPKTSANTKEGSKESLRTIDVGGLRTKEIIASAEEKIIAKAVNKVPGINPSANFTRNQNKIVAHKDALIKELDDGLKALPASEKDLIKEASESIDSAVSKMLNEKIFLKEGSKDVKEIVTAANKILANTDNSAHGIWKARIELDRLVKEAKGSFPDKAGMFDSANRSIRGALNEVVVKNSKGVKTQRLLDSSSNLFKAIDNIAPKAKAEATNMIMRQVHNLTEVLGARSKILGIAAIGLGTTQLAASQAVAGPIGAGISLYLGAKGINSAWKTPAFKKGLGELLKATDEGLRIATSSQMRKQLRVDRAAIVELLENIDFESPEEKADPAPEAKKPSNPNVNKFIESRPQEPEDVQISVPLTDADGTPGMATGINGSDMVSDIKSRQDSLIALRAALG